MLWYGPCVHSAFLALEPHSVPGMMAAMPLPLPGLLVGTSPLLQYMLFPTENGLIVACGDKWTGTEVWNVIYRVYVCMCICMCISGLFLAQLM